MRWFYGVLVTCVFLVIWPVLVFHPKLRDGFWERLGFYRHRLPEGNKGSRVWFHGASAGDILALLPTIRALKATRPQVRVILSTVTNTGREIIEKNSDTWDAWLYLPFDIPFAVNRCLHHVRPQILVLEYTELWPALIHAAHAKGVALVLHNGRFSERKLGSYRRLFRLTGKLLPKFSGLLMRDDDEAERVLSLGAPAESVKVTGNTKFDRIGDAPSSSAVAELRQHMHFASDALVWIAGSTHEGEEGPLIDVYMALREKHPQLRMVIAPRYTDRAERIAAIAHKRGLAVARRSQSPPQAPPDLFILDTIGELVTCYAAGDVVFVGGSFVRRGGQNILEPASCGKPVIFGPRMKNFEDSVRVLLGRGGIQVATPAQLISVLTDLIEDPQRRSELGSLAQTQVQEATGAAARNAAVIDALCAKKAVS